MSDIDTYVVGSGGKPTIKKDPNATLDYPFDWSVWLGLINDTIASVTWIIDASLTSVATGFTAVTATIFVSGGVAGTTVPITCRITTAGNGTSPRIEDRTILLKITER